VAPRLVVEVAADDDRRALGDHVALDAVRGAADPAARRQTPAHTLARRGGGLAVGEAADRAGALLTGARRIVARAPRARLVGPEGLLDDAEAIDRLEVALRARAL